MSLVSTESETKNNTGAEGSENKGSEESILTKKVEGTETKETETKTEAKETEGAPEKYEAFKVPDGMTFDEGLMTQFQDIAKELNMPQANAQKFIDFLAQAEAKTNQDLLDMLDKKETDWEAELKADKDFGGANYAENTIRSKRAFDKYDNTLGGKLTELVNEYRLGNNPALIKLFYHLDKAIAEDKHVEGEQQSKKPKSAAEVLYPNQGKE